MRSLFSIPVRESQTCRHSRIPGISTANTLVEQSLSLSDQAQFPQVSRRVEFISHTLRAAFQRHRRLIVSRGRTGQANPAVQPTATSRGLRHEVTSDSITPSCWLHSHPSCRRSVSELSDTF